MGRAQATDEERQADSQNYRAGDKAEDWEETFGDDVTGREERHDAERKDA